MTSEIRLDLHVHSRHSPDSSLALPQIVARIGVVGLHGFALTDHNTIAGHRELAALAREYPSYRFIPGVEVSTREGHLLLYGVSELPPIHRPIVETLDWARAHGAVASIAHPFRWAHGVGRAVASTAPSDALEAINGHNSEITNARAALLAARRKLGETGGSDAHTVPHIGRAFTEFPEDHRSLDDLLDEVRRGRTRALGRSLGAGGRLRVGIRTSLLRVARGFRPI
jgi:predicted metal-dependent phosphoesterase TrpH